MATMASNCQPRIPLSEYPIYNGAKPEYPCSVFLGAFSVLRRENDQLTYTVLQPTSIRFGRDAKTATRDASVERIGEIPLRQPCFPDNDAIFAKGCQGVQPNAMIFIGEAQRMDASNRQSQPSPRDRDCAAHRHISRNARAS